MDLSGGHTPCVLTIFFVFIFFMYVSYKAEKYSDFGENENIFRLVV